MCGIFGFVKYGKEIKGLDKLTNSLAVQSAERGTDATGIAFVKKGDIKVVKEAKSAYEMSFKHSDGLKALIGHTRHSTQGDKKHNYNNHPWFGCTKKGDKFALAHNGVLWNDKELRLQKGIKTPKIETDSFIAVQLLEQNKKLNFKSMQKMAEDVDGSFNFSILDADNNVYIVKGDNPICILNFYTKGIFVYASTEEILYRAIIDSPLFEELKSNSYENIKCSCGDIVKLGIDGTIEKSEFEYSYYSGKKWYEYGGYYDSYDWYYGDKSTTKSTSKGKDSEATQSYDYDNDEYISLLEECAAEQGFHPSIVEEMLCEGYNIMEIEDYIYSPDAYLYDGYESYYSLNDTTTCDIKEK